jgi:trans-2,3-dihydro-3-hydroxyanthranilate isomerase
MTSLRYEVVDVFTDRPFTGNPLAVVFGGDDLATDQLQAIAREFNLSETIFIMAPTRPDATYRARIFTPAAEIPFAGHPSVGAAVTLLRTGRYRAGPVVQECGAGLLPIEVADAGTATLTGGHPTIGPHLDPRPLLAAVGLADRDLAGSPARSASCGLDFTYLPVQADAVARAVPDGPAIMAATANSLDVFAWDRANNSAHARVFAPRLGVLEDPATGSAALGLGVWLVAVGLVPADGTAAYRVRQGVEIHRPATLDCTVTANRGRAVSATVAGHVTPIAAGEIAVPPFVG